MTAKISTGKHARSSTNFRKAIDGTVGSFKTTKDIFQSQLHVYTITHAIDDKNVLRFHIDYFKPDKKVDVSSLEHKSAVMNAIINKHDAATHSRREFSLDDLRVLSYVTNYWEDEPDIECIKIGLNNRSHFEYPYNEFIISLAPLFSDPPDDIEEAFPSYVLFNEVQDGLELFHLASAYKTGGEMLADAAIDNHNGYEIIYPIIYNYRHAVELYLKSYVGSMGNTHSLIILYNKFKELMMEKFKASPAEWFESIIETLHEFDPGGTSFQYGTSDPRYEVFVDLSVLKAKMNLLSRAFQEIEIKLDRQ